MSSTRNPVQPACSARALVVFVRYPKVGTVKTRLAAGLGATAALELYKSFVSSILLESLRCAGASVHLALAAPTEHQLLCDWLSETAPPETFKIMQQSTHPDLGVRMLQAMEHVMQAGAAKVVLVGSDIPDLDASILIKAFDVLKRHEIVFGPAQDGGFYLVGAQRLHQHLFQGLTWSTSEVLKDAVKQAQACGLDVAAASALPCLRDIDTSEDLQQWLNGAGSKAEQHSMRQLASAALSNGRSSRPA